MRALIFDIDDLGKGCRWWSWGGSGPVRVEMDR